MHDIFFFTDVHGCYDLYRAAMTYCFEQDPECTIIFGGDACDRGKDGYTIMKDLLANPQVGYLKGNHEDMFIYAALTIKQNYNGPLDSKSIDDFLISQYQKDEMSHIKLHLANSGYQTLKDWMLDGMPSEIINQLIHLPITFSYENLDFCHAGGRYKEFKRVAEAEYNEDWPNESDEAILIWNRSYLGHGWAPNRTCIFGHTPTPTLASKYYGKDKSLANAHPCAYTGLLDERFNGRKIDMDTGAVASGRLYVLNCLTLQAQGFYDKNIVTGENHKHEIEKIEVIKF